MDEAILGGLRSGEDLPDFDYEDFEAGSTGQDRRGEDPGRDTPRSRGRYTDDGDDRISVRPPMMNKDEELAPIGTPSNQVLDKDIWTSSVWR